ETAFLWRHLSAQFSGARTFAVIDMLPDDNVARRWYVISLHWPLSSEGGLQPLPPTPSPKRRGGEEPSGSPSPLRGGGWREGLCSCFAPPLGFGGGAGGRGRPLFSPGLFRLQLFDGLARRQITPFQTGIVRCIPIGAEQRAAAGRPKAGHTADAAH